MKTVSRVCHLCHLIMILSNHNIITRISFFFFFFFFFCGENIYLPFMKFLHRKSLFKNVIDQNFSICQPNFIFFFFATNCMPNCAKKKFLLDLNSCKISVKTHYQTQGNTLEYSLSPQRHAFSKCPSSHFKKRKKERKEACRMLI